jgi:hypothetical protein
MHRVARALSLVLAFLMSPLALPSAAAAPLVSSSSRATHCVHDLSDRTQQCFATFTEAIAAATDGAITDAPAQPAQAVADPAFAQRLDAVASSAVLGISWANINYSGSSVTWTASFGCDDSVDVDWQVSNVGSTWNDRISSAQSFSHCQSKYWENAGFTGQSTAWFTSASTFGTMNDKATSIKFR